MGAFPLEFFKFKCQDKWNNVYNEEFHWPKIWNNLKRLDISNKLKNSNGNATITLFTPKVDLEQRTYPMEISFYFYF
jgi:hypothetical protein